MVDRSSSGSRRQSRSGSAAGFLVLVVLILSVAGLRADERKTEAPTPQPVPPTTQPPAPFIPPAPVPDSPRPEPPPPPGFHGGAGVPGGPSGFSGPGVGPGFGQQVGSPGMPFPGRRFTFTIDPNTAVKDLLPPKPKEAAAPGPLLSDDLAKVPEVEFQARPAKDAQPNDLTKTAAHQLAKINHLNAKKADAFMAALLENRPDLAGMPFVMGGACRTSAERSRQFSRAVALVRQALANSQGNPNHGAVFWQQYTSLVQQDDANRGRSDRATAEHVALARVAALTQMLAPESPDLRRGLAKYLAGASHVEATKALARMAMFSAEDDVRQAAIDALKVRREKDYTDILVNGLRYPHPAVAKRAANAIAKLERADLIPELVAVLERDDARLPVTKECGGKKVTVVRELVKVNHHRNCMMCHSPGGPGTVPGDTLTAEVPVQGQPLPTPAQGYAQSSPDLMVRIDVTYLRQDFSATLPVPDAHPWPEAQRFDFFVRERTLTDEQAAEYREKLTPREEGVLSPYHRAALAALRDMTGKDTAPTAAAWRKLLNLPARKVD